MRKLSFVHADILGYADSDFILNVTEQRTVKEKKTPSVLEL